MRRRKAFTNEALPEFDYSPEERERIERLRLKWSTLSRPEEEEEIEDEED